VVLNLCCEVAVSTGLSMLIRNFKPVLWVVFLSHIATHSFIVRVGELVCRGGGASRTLAHVTTGNDFAAPCKKKVTCDNEGRKT
jgi:hypothetical protein